MKKTILILIISFALILLGLLTSAVVISFTVIKPTTDSINQKLATKFSKIVRIPQGIQSPFITVNSTGYFWEMETIENEVTGVKFMFDPSFTSDKKEIEAILDMPENGDASIFNKVLPAVIADEQTVKSVKDWQKANLGANDQAGYSKIDLVIKPETKQVIRVTWVYEKENLGDELTGDYQKLTKYKKPLFGFLYELPNLIIGLLSG